MSWRPIRRFSVREALDLLFQTDEEGIEVEPEIEEEVSEIVDNDPDFDPDHHKTEQSTDGEDEAPEEEAQGPLPHGPLPQAGSSRLDAWSWEPRSGSFIRRIRMNLLSGSELKTTKNTNKEEPVWTIDHMTGRELHPALFEGVEVNNCKFSK